MDRVRGWGSLMEKGGSGTKVGMEGQGRRKWTDRRTGWIPSGSGSSSYLDTYEGCQSIGFSRYWYWEWLKAVGNQKTPQRCINDILEWCDQDVKGAALMTEDRGKWRRFVASPVASKVGTITGLKRKKKLRPWKVSSYHHQQQQHRWEQGWRNQCFLK